MSTANITSHIHKSQCGPCFWKRQCVFRIPSWSNGFSTRGRWISQANTILTPPPHVIINDGARGILIGIDGEEGIVKIVDNATIRIVPMSSLVAST
jgi:hypothetical protein